jgi:hypothetical protein
MNISLLLRMRAAYLVGSLLFLLAPSSVRAHCDTMNGPVVIAAKKALETGNVNLVLIWVQKRDEAEIRAAFAKTLAVRKLNTEAKNLADMYFFETLVRVHRAGEGVPYTGLKPAEAVVDPGIAAADKSLEARSPDALLNHLNEAVQAGIHHQFDLAVQKKNFRADDVESGRAYVKAYVEFIHYVERLYQAATKPAEGHFHETEQLEHH